MSNRAMARQYSQSTGGGYGNNLDLFGLQAKRRMKEYQGISDIDQARQTAILEKEMELQRMIQELDALKSLEVESERGFQQRLTDKQKSDLELILGKEKAGQAINALEVAGSEERKNIAAKGEQNLFNARTLGEQERLNLTTKGSEERRIEKVRGKQARKTQREADEQKRSVDVLSSDPLTQQSLIESLRAQKFGESQFFNSVPGQEAIQTGALNLAVKPAVENMKMSEWNLPPGYTGSRLNTLPTSLFPNIDTGMGSSISTTEYETKAIPTETGVQYQPFPRQTQQWTPGRIGKPVKLDPKLFQDSGISQDSETQSIVPPITTKPPSNNPALFDWTNMKSPVQLELDRLMMLMQRQQRGY